MLALLQASHPAFGLWTCPLSNTHGVGFAVLTESAFRVGYAMTFWDDERGRSVGWRYSLAASFIPAIFFILVLPFMQES